MHDFICQELEALAQSDYKKFNSRLVTTAYPMYGIRIPALRALAKKLARDGRIVDSYLDCPQFDSYESVLLYGMVLGNCKNISFDAVLLYLDGLIPFFDNWAHVDCVTSSLKVLKSNPDKVLTHYLPLKEDGGEFTKRFFVVLLLSFYLNDQYIDQTLMHLTQVPQGQYYVDMAIAWTLSVALVKYYDKTLPLLQQETFSKFVHNMAIQKARESLRILPQTKIFLNRFKK